MSTAVTPPNNQGNRPAAAGDARADSASARTTPDRTDRTPDTGEMVRRQKERFGGMKFGSCFFGWLTATGTAVLLTALLSSAGAAFGLSKSLTAADADSSAQTVGIVGGIVLLAIVLLAYYCGGYVAGRMARFNGLRQGLGVWLWAIIVAVVVAVLGLVAGAKFNVLANLNGFPRIPIDEGTLTTGGIITAVVLVVAALIGAVLGGLSGMRFHRRVDHADLTPDPETR